MTEKQRWTEVRQALGNIAWVIGALGLVLMALGGMLVWNPVAVAGIAAVCLAPVFYLVSWLAFRPRHKRAMEAERRNENIVRLERELGL